jgi:hypothetical protein
MTQDANGSATVTDTVPDAGIPDPSKGGGGQGSTTTAPSDPFAGLQDAGIREWVGKQGLKDVESLAKKAFAAESLIGRSVQVPGADAKPDEIDKYLDKATAQFRPKDAGGYEYKLPDGLPEDFAYDKSFADESKGWAAKHKLTAGQAQGLHDEWVGKQAEAHRQAREALAKQVTETADTLVKEWGPLDGEKFKSEAELAHRALKGLDLEESFHKLGLLTKIGNDEHVVRDPKVALALARVGRDLFKEDGLVTGSPGGAAGNNPFLSGNTTEQNILWNKNRDTAVRMIQAAGKTPADFGFKA